MNANSFGRPAPEVRHTLDTVLSVGVDTLVNNATAPLRGQRDSLLNWISAVRKASALSDAEAISVIRDLVREFEEDR